MASEAGSPAASFSPQVVAKAFVKQYYQILRYARQDAYKFYNDSSILGRSDSSGKMMSVTTINDIKKQLLSTDFAECLIEIETVDAQPSHVDGVLILVAGYFTTDAIKKKFTQSFFLAPQENRGYYVLNDMFRLTPLSTEAKEVVANHDKSTQITTLPNEPASFMESTSTVPDVPLTEAISTSLNDHVVEACVKEVDKDVEKIPTAAPAPPATAEKAVSKDVEEIHVATTALPATAEKAVNKDVEEIPVVAPGPATSEKAVNKDVEERPVAAPGPATGEKAVNKDVEEIPVAAPGPATGEKAVNKDLEKIPEAAPAPPTLAEKEVTKKTYASIVKTMRESTQPAPSAKPAKPNPRPKAAQNAEKSVSSPSKPAHAINTALPGDKSVPKNKSPDEPGYSVFVKNLPFEATVEMVEQEFSKFGAIKSGGIQVKKHQPDQFCFGFVEFVSQQSMLAALEASTVYFGTRESYVEEKRTKTRVIDGVITHRDDNGNGGGSRFQSGRGGYNGDSYKQQGGVHSNGYYNDGDSMRNDYSGRVRGHQGNGYPQNGNGYHHQNRNGYLQNGNGYYQINGSGYSGNGYQQRRPNNGNGRVERGNGPRQQAPVAA